MENDNFFSQISLRYHNKEMELDFYNEESRARIRQIAVVVLYQVIMNIIYIAEDFTYMYLINLAASILLFIICFYFQRWHKYIFVVAIIFISYSHSKFLQAQTAKYPVFSNGQVFVLYYTVSPSDFIYQTISVVLGQAIVTYYLSSGALEIIRLSLWTLTFLVFLYVQYRDKKVSYFLQQKQYKVDQIIKNNIFQQILLTSFNYITHSISVYETIQQCLNLFNQLNQNKNVIEKNSKMELILEESEASSNLKQCLEQFEIIQSNNQVKKCKNNNLYKYLLKKHFEMETNNGERFQKKENSKIPSQNIPLRKAKNVSILDLNRQSSQKTLQNLEQKDNQGEKCQNEEQCNQNQEHEVLNLIKNDKQTFRARISTVYLNQPLIMIIFENQEIVKNNIKLKKQLAVSNNVLLNFFKEVNAKSNILKSLIFNNEIMNAKFLFSLLQNNIYSIEQYLRKRGIEGRLNQNSQQIEASCQSPLNNENRQVLKFDIFSESKMTRTSIDLSRLFKNKSKNILKNNSMTDQCNNNDKQTKLFSSYLQETEKRNSLHNGDQYPQAFHTYSFTNDLKIEDPRTVSQSVNQLDDINSNSILSEKRLNFFDEQNDFDYFDRIKLKKDYNLENVCSKNNLNKCKNQGNIYVESNEIEVLEKTKIKHKKNGDIQSYIDKDEQQATILSDLQDIRQLSTYMLDNKLQSLKPNSFHKASLNTNTSFNGDKQTSTSNHQLYKTLANDKQNNIKALQNNFSKKQNHEQFLILNQKHPSNLSNMPSANNIFSQQNQNSMTSQQQQVVSFTCEGNALTDFNIQTNKLPLKKVKSNNPSVIGQDLSKGNIKQFEFIDIIEDINLFRSEIHIKWDSSLNQTKILSDKDMILYILRSLLSSILVINEKRKKEANNFKIKTLSTMNQCSSPEQNIKKLAQRQSIQKKSLQQIILLNELKQKDDDYQSQSYYSYNKDNTPLSEISKQIDLRYFSDQQREMSSDQQKDMSQDQQREMSQDNKQNCSDSSQMHLRGSYNNRQPPNSLNSPSLLEKQAILLNILDCDTQNNDSNGNKTLDHQTNPEDKQKIIEETKKILQLNQLLRKQDDKLYENKKSNFVLHSIKDKGETQVTLRNLNGENQQAVNNQDNLAINGDDDLAVNNRDNYAVNNMENQGVNGGENELESKQVEENVDDSEIDLPFDMYEVDVEFSLEKNKYCKSILVNINNISKQELISCLNFNINKEVSKIEYEIIKLIIQKIGPYPLYSEARKICFAFLLDLSEIVEGSSFFNLPNENVNLQQQEQMLFQIPEEDNEIAQTQRQNKTTENNENIGFDN